MDASHCLSYQMQHFCNIYDLDFSIFASGNSEQFDSNVSEQNIINVM